MNAATLRTDEAFRCVECGNQWYYTRRHCQACGSDQFDTYELGTGELVATTTVRVTPPDVRSPNPLGVARFDSIRVTAQLADETLSVGDPVVFGGAYRLRTNDTTCDVRLTNPTEPD
jgi:uncharacterized OB-fold protein